MKDILKRVAKDKRILISVIIAAVLIMALVITATVAAHLRRGKNIDNITDNSTTETRTIQETTAQDVAEETSDESEEATQEQEVVIVDESAVKDFFNNEISTEDEDALELPYRQLTSEFIPYDGVRREITCYGDSMMAGAGSATPGTVNGIDIYGWTSPYTLERFSKIPTHNLGVSGEDSYRITFRAGGVKVYLDRDITITEHKYAIARLIDDDGNVFSYDDYSGYIYGYDHGPGEMYIDGYLCDVENIGDRQVQIKLTEGYAVYNGNTVTNIVLYESETESVPDNTQNKESSEEKPSEQPTETPTTGEIKISAGTQAMTRASQERSAKDILVLEMGSNGGWENDYKQLILQYDDIILNSGCKYYIIVGDTDNPADSVDIYQDEYGEDGNYVGIGDTAWEAALREAYGEHFFNARTYMIQNGLNDCGLDTTTDDLENFRKGNISEQLRHDWTHFNCYGYYAKGVGIYKKGVELGYWS